MYARVHTSIQLLRLLILADMLEEEFSLTSDQFDWVLLCEAYLG